MKSFSHIFVALLLGLSMTSCIASSCDFDPKAIKQPTMQNEKIEGANWNPEKLEYRAIASDGSIFLVRYWACDHSGLSAQLVTSRTDDSSNLKTLIGRLANDVLNASLNAAVNKAISREMPIAPGKDIEISVPGVTEFWVSVKQLDYLTVISISYYES